MREYQLSIDASLSSTGWAVLDKATKEVIDLGRICTTPKLAEDERVMTIVLALLEIRSQYSIEEVVMEDGYMYKNLKTGMQLCGLRGGITVAMKLAKAKIIKKQPSEIKLALLGEGKGNAGKEIVAQMVLDLYPNNIHVQNLGPFNDKSGKAKNSDMYDAIAIGVAQLLVNERAAEAQTA